jgi:hypothetical protein
MGRAWQMRAAQSLESISSLVYILKLHEGIIALDLDALEAAVGLKMLLQVALACAVCIKVHHKQSRGRLHLSPPQILTAPHLSIHLFSTGFGSQRQPTDFAESSVMPTAGRMMPGYI